MSDLDRKLEEALAALDGEEGAAASGRAVARGEAASAVVPGGARVRTRAQGQAWLLVGVLALGAGMLALVITSFSEAGVYSLSVDALLDRAETLGGRTVRVEGTLVKGTLTRRDEPCEYRFFITQGERKLEVRYGQCIVPDTFQDRPETDVSVTAEGRMTPEGFLQATQIYAKCPSKYEERSRTAGSMAEGG